MRYHAEDIKDFNPNDLYELFDNGDALVENSPLFDTLSTKAKKALATKIVLGCPQEKIKEFGHAIRALSSYIKEPDQDTFYSLISEAHQVKTRLLAVLDPKNGAPYQLFLEEAIGDLFNKFSVLTTELLEKNQVLFAERLALTTPVKEVNTVMLQIHHIKGTSFSETMAAAFTLRHHLPALLSDNPELFFTSKDFNAELPRKFPQLLEIIQGHEAEIGAKLARITSLEMQSSIKHQLQLLTSEIHDQTNPFSLIVKAMQPNKPISLGSNPHAHFGSAVEKESIQSAPLVQLANLRG